MFSEIFTIFFHRIFLHSLPRFHPPFIFGIVLILIIIKNEQKKKIIIFNYTTLFSSACLNKQKRGNQKAKTLEHVEFIWCEGWLERRGKTAGNTKKNCEGINKKLTLNLYILISYSLESIKIRALQLATRKKSWLSQLAPKILGKNPWH